MQREQDEGYIWASYASKDADVLEEVTMWPEGESVIVEEVLTDLVERIKQLEEATET